MGIDVANHMSHLESVDVDRVRRAVDRERLENLEEVRLNDTVIRRRSKSAAGGTAVRAPAPAAPPPPAPRRHPVLPSRPPRSTSRPSSPRRAAPRARSRSPNVTRRSPPRHPRPRPARRPLHPCPASASAGSSAGAGNVASAGGAGGVGTAGMSAAAGGRHAHARAGARRAQDHRAAGRDRIGGDGRVHPAPRHPAARRRPGAARIEIKDRDEELRRLGRGAPVMRQPGAGRNQFGRPGFGPGGRPGGVPKKRVAAAGKKLKQTQITTPAEHKRVIRMDDTIAVAELAKKMGVKGREIIKKLWALGMMERNINKDIDLDTATLIATEFGFQIESTAFNEDEVLDERRDPGEPGGSAPARPGRHHHGPRRPRQDVAARRHPQGQRRGGRGRRHHPAHRRLQGVRATAATSSSSTRPATRRSPRCAPAARR